MLSISNLLRKTWRVYKERFWIFMGIMAAPMILTWIIALAGAVTGISTTFFSALLFKSSWPIFIAAFLAGLVFLGLGFLILFWPHAALLFAIKEREEKIGVEESFKKGWSKVLSLAWISFLSSLVIGIGFLLFIIPGIVFGIWFSLALYVLIGEDIKGTKALSRSKELVKGNWWAVFIRFIVITFILIFFSIILGWIPKIGSSLVSLVLAPFSTCFGFLLYQDLRGEKELEKSEEFPLPRKPGL